MVILEALASLGALLFLLILVAGATAPLWYRGPE